MSQFGVEGVGDNIEFTAVDIADYTIWTNQTGTDTATTKFPSANPLTARKIEIRTNQSADLVKLNTIEFTDPVTIVINKAHIEQRNVPTINNMVIRTTVANTTIKVRWF